MNIDALKKIRSLRSDAAAIGGFHARYDAKYRSDSSCDKKGFGFSRDARFAAFSTNVSFDSWAGYYGNSSCHSILSVSDADAVKKAFISALNANQKLIFASMQKIMLDEAASLSDKATQEISALQAMLDEVRADPIDPAEAA